MEGYNDQKHSYRPFITSNIQTDLSPTSRLPNPPTGKAFNLRSSRNRITPKGREHPGKGPRGPGTPRMRGTDCCCGSIGKDTAVTSWLNPMPGHQFSVACIYRDNIPAYVFLANASYAISLIVRVGGKNGGVPGT